MIRCDFIKPQCETAVDLDNKSLNVTLDTYEKRRGKVIQTDLLAHEIDWLLTSPPLLTPKAHPRILAQGANRALLPWLARQALENTSVFEDMLAQRRSTRLGIRYETLWQFLYKQTPNCKILASNLPVRDTTRTLGEFDLLYQKMSQPAPRYIHQEMAIKFYLGKPCSQGNWFDWIGPDHSDQLGVKMKKMFDSQIRLSHTDDGKRVLNQLTGHQIWEQELLIQGYLFYPWNKPCQAPDNSHPRHLRGDWLPLKQLRQYCESLGTDAFLIPPRQFWLSLQAPSEELTALLTVYSLSDFSSSLTQHITQTNKPILATAELLSGTRKLFFVTPDHW
ncbi:DUF1853 family protein [Sansalvadorimonas verongulae]|uniref:DUF1853 family protein n=1 Tax=Sansalvadorimonas verongulae TaxID=2172824 RepID=UPI0012BB6744|nr:DUF1853 family protein [Sansalvadorimonas verongulae]MTI14337.1 DUF1853 family protein [Sansalvadorimonas verongulae]